MGDPRHMGAYNLKALVATNMGEVQVHIRNQLNNMEGLDKVPLKKLILHIVHPIITKIHLQVWEANPQHFLQTLLNLKVFGEVNSKLLVKQNSRLIMNRVVQTMRPLLSATTHLPIQTLFWKEIIISYQNQEDLGDNLHKQYNLSPLSQPKMIRNRKNRKIIHLKEMFKANQVMIMVQKTMINRNNLFKANNLILEIF